MKILLTTESFPPEAGGSGQSTAALARALARRGHQVSVAVGRRSVPGESERIWDGIPIIEVGLGQSGAGPGRSRRLEERFSSFLAGWAPGESFDLAHAQHFLSAGPTTEAGKLAGFPVVVTVRDYWPVCIWSTMLSGNELCPGCSYWRRVVCVGRHRPFLWPASPLLPPLVGAEIERRRRFLRSAAAVVAVNQHVRNLLQIENTVVIPNLVDIPSIERALSGPLPPGLPERFALFVGKLEPNKAPDLVLPILRAAGWNLPLLVAGRGSLFGSLKAEAARSGADVRFLGWIETEAVLRLMSRAEAVLFPSRWQEPLSRVLLEGLGAGAVLIVQPTGGSEEIVVDGESGLLGRTVDEMAAALRRVSTDNRLAARLREGARLRARERFSEEAVLPRIESLYDEVLHRARVSA